MSEQDNMSERCALIAGPRSPERCALIAGGWDAWDVPGDLPDPGGRVEWRNTDGTRSGVIDSYQVGPGVVTLGAAQRAAGLADTDFFWRVVDAAPDTVRSEREPEPEWTDAARDCAIYALGEAIECPHSGRLGEAVDALRDYVLDGSHASLPSPARDCAIYALGDAIERPHNGRLAEAVDALRDYALDGAPRHDAIPPPANVPRGLSPLDRVPRGVRVAAVCMGAFVGAALTFLPGWLLGAAFGAAVVLAGLGARDAS